MTVCHARMSGQSGSAGLQGRRITGGPLVSPGFKDAGLRPRGPVAWRRGGRSGAGRARGRRPWSAWGWFQAGGEGASLPALCPGSRDATPAAPLCSPPSADRQDGRVHEGPVHGQGGRRGRRGENQARGHRGRGEDQGGRPLRRWASAGARRGGASAGRGGEGRGQAGAVLPPWVGGTQPQGLQTGCRGERRWPGPDL